MAPSARHEDSDLQRPGQRGDDDEVHVGPLLADLLRQSSALLLALVSEGSIPHLG